MRSLCCTDHRDQSSVVCNELNDLVEDFVFKLTSSKKRKKIILSSHRLNAINKLAYTISIIAA